MKVFDKLGYAAHIRKKIPGYELMQEICFRGILEEEKKKATVEEILAIAAQKEEVEALLELFPKAHITVVEPSEVMLEELKKSCQGERYMNLNFICDKFEQLFFLKKFDLCLCMLVFHFVEDEEAFLANLHRYLKSWAPCVFSVFTKEDLPYWQNVALAAGAKKEDIERTFEHQEEIMRVYSMEEVEDLLRKAGFQSRELLVKILPIAMYLLKKVK